MLDQRRAQLQTLQRGIDVGDVLATDDDIVARQLAAQVIDRVLEAEIIGCRIHMDAQRAKLVMRLIGHPLLAKAGDHVDAIALARQVAGEQPDLGLLAADDQPCEDEQNADLARVGMRLRKAVGRAAAPGALMRGGAVMLGGHLARLLGAVRQAGALFLLVKAHVASNTICRKSGRSATRWRRKSGASS